MKYLSYGVSIPLYVFVALLPLLLLPAPFGGDFGRELVFSGLVVIALIAWLARTLASGEFRYVHSPILYAAGGVAAVMAASTLVSHAPFVSVFFADAPAERLSLLITGVLLMIAASSALHRREEAGTALLILIFAGAVAALIAAMQMLFNISIVKYFNSAADAGANNVIGTVNGLALFFAALAMMAMGMLLSSAAGAWKKKKWVRVALGAAGALFLLDMVLINFLSAWVAMLGAAVLLFGLLLIEGVGDAPRQAGGRRVGGFAWRHWVAIGLVIFSLLMIMVRGPVFSRLVFPAEVSPSFSATLSVAGALFKEGPVRVFFGSGPGTFGILWEKYKDPSINQTIFWGVRFTQGQSWAATLLATTGVLGFASMLVFFAVALVTFLRTLITGRRNNTGDDAVSMAAVQTSGAPRQAGGDALGMSVFLGFATLLVAAFLYPANLSLILLFFFAAGLLSLVVAAPLHEHEGVMDEGAGVEGMDGADAEGMYGRGEEMSGGGDASDAFSVADHDGVMHETHEAARAEGGFFGDAPDDAPVSARPPEPFWSIRARMVRFATPWSIFVSSLVIVFLLAAGAAALYENATRAAAAVAAAGGVAAANKGDIDGALAAFGRAADREPHDFHMLQALVQVRAAKIQQIIGRAGAGQNVQQEFQSAVSAAVQDSQRLTQIYPDEPEVWRTQGGLYEIIIPYIQGSERFAVTAYQKAVERAPANPAIYTDWGRAGLVFTDRILALENQAGIKDKDKEQLAAARKQNLEQIGSLFQRAIAIKPDFAAAHFLLAQTAIRLGNLDAAIASVENARSVAPFDIGVAFQLGLLYYQKQDFDKAEAEFERAVSIDENYSNARYFLGLIRDKKGDTAGALGQFNKIVGLNPDNAEVKHIVDNLTAGKPALDGIVPPAPPPEKRKDAPVKEKEQKK